MSDKVLVCGSRDWNDSSRIYDVLRTVKFLSGPFTVIHGDCRGADKIAGFCAKRLGIRVEPFPADWKTHSSTCRCQRGAPFCRQAGFRRNSQMADEKPVLVLAFQMNRSGGTQQMMDIARERGIDVLCFEDTRPSTQPRPAPQPRKGDG